MAIYVGSTPQSFGQSAYDFAVAGGYTGTEQQFAAILNNLGSADPIVVSSTAPSTDTTKIWIKP